jgi:probable F420-dependent oxidoreductase
MAAAAAVTSTLRIGCRVFCIDYHVPAALAKEAATIELLSDGRLEMGLGAGLQEPEYRALGVDFAPGRQRVDKLEEVVALLKAHWSGEQIDIRGDHVHVTGYSGLPAPVQRPHPPIMIGGNRKRILSYAAREADIVSIANVPYVPVNEAGRTPREEMIHRYDTVRAAAGDRIRLLEFESAPYFTIVTDAPATAYAEIGGWIGADPAVMPTHPNVLVGTLDAIAERIAANREDFGTNYVTVPLNAYEAFAPLVARLSGT